MSNLTPYDDTGAESGHVNPGHLNPGERLAPGERPLLIKLDIGFILRIEAEREVLTGGTGHKLPRTAMIRMLLKEALDARQRARNEQVPSAIVVARGPDGELDTSAASAAEAA